MPATTSLLMALRLSGRLMVIQNAAPRFSWRTAGVSDSLMVLRWIGYACVLGNALTGDAATGSGGSLYRFCQWRLELDLRDHAQGGGLVANLHMHGADPAGSRGHVDVLHLHGFQRHHGLARLDLVARGHHHVDHPPVHGGAQLAIPGGLASSCGSCPGVVLDTQRRALVVQQQRTGIAMEGGALDQAITIETNRMPGQRDGLEGKARLAHGDFEAI